jgi:uncharacterized protein YcbK (DUF882 family)
VVVARTGAAARRPAARSVGAFGLPVLSLPAVALPTVAVSPFGAARSGPASDAVPPFGAAGTARSPRPAFDAARGGASVDLDTLVGRSGKLRARFVVPSAAGLFSYLRRLVGDSTEVRPGVYPAPEGGARRPFAYIAMLPFAEKVNGNVGRYRIGFWPGERGGDARRVATGGKYGLPAGFIQVTPDNAETPVSEHFRLRDFLTHDQARVWPKYLVLDAALVDKLELVISDLRARGYRADRLHVMSGFRTPQYNQGGGDPRGRAELSRHQYGDAADVWVENGDGSMADLNGDGRVDARDAAVLAEAAERVERAHPELAGGVGVYHGTRAHGPFVHIDTRGHKARWGAG